MTLLATVLMAFVLVPNAGQALATHVACGDTVTQDTTLDSDLAGCGADGLVIGADGITLDLNGHLIDASGTGVNNYSETHSDVTVENGTIRAGTGVDLGPRFSTGPVADRNVIRGLSIFAASYGVTGHDASFFFPGGDENSVERNVIRAGIFGVLLKGAGLVVQGNDVEDGGIIVDGNCLGRGPGCPSGVRDAGATVEKNVLRCRNSCIQLHADDTTVSKNSVTCRSDGIDVQGFNVVVEKNSVSGCGLGIFQERGTARIEKNELRENFGDGIRTRDQLGGRLLKVVLLKNVAVGNTGDGIEAGRGTTLEKNTASHNGELGIEAASEAIDGGGNKSFGNGDPLQCLNIACK